MKNPAQIASYWAHVQTAGINEACKYASQEKGKTTRMRKIKLKRINKLLRYALRGAGTW